jgi:hypothetical protein
MDSLLDGLRWHERALWTSADGLACVEVPVAGVDRPHPGVAGELTVALNAALFDEEGGRLRGMRHATSVAVLWLPAAEPEPEPSSRLLLVFSLRREGDVIVPGDELYAAFREAVEAALRRAELELGA